ncbi:LysR family transcriptional regulator [Cognatishimia sp. 1_MG-2023]|uniref:LysR family transcriptional regulator n=1 Tax=Cognatishimia sp. 1_MG-2023 TaxID=3062642 RepID=UPI0026E3F504|nr:LysR family transcriptional regulator [Cognatishimia sp. 1_MG-2023]MDO6728201.1 LysR family transcriptional regulator [Cognatishimia sp. 1_MG-2023]
MKNNLQYLNAMRAFEAAARHVSFAAASSELNVSHSVISRHVRNLELWYEVDLFVRSGNHVELSEEGHVLFSEIRKPFQVLRDASEKFTARTRNNKVSLTVSAEPAVAARWLRRQITAYCDEVKNVEVDLLPTWRPQGAEGTKTDLAVHFAGRLPGAENAEESLFPVLGYPACSPKLIEGLESDCDFDTLAEQLPLVHDNGRRIWQNWFAQHRPGSDLWEEGKVYTDFSLAIGAAVDGEGIILADDIICASEFRNGSLVRIDERGTKCTEYVISQLADKSTQSAAEALKNWLIKMALRDRHSSFRT